MTKQEEQKLSKLERELQQAMPPLSDDQKELRKLLFKLRERSTSEVRFVSYPACNSG